MKFYRTHLPLGQLVFFLFAQAAILPAAEQEIPASAGTRKAAIIVENRAGRELNDKVPVLEDLLSTRIAGAGFTILSRDVVTRGLKDYSPTGNQGPTPLDRALETNTTALRLAQNLGADYLLVPTITTHSAAKTTSSAYGVNTTSVKHTLRVGLKIIEAGDGGALRGSLVTSTKFVRTSEGLQTDAADVLNELLDDAATQIAAELVKLLKTDGSALPTTIAAAKTVSFSIACSMTDLKELPITVPDLAVSADNKVVRGAKNLDVQALDVTVELDGVALGSAPGSFQARPGLHKLTLSREGFSSWERTINVFEGQKLNVALSMSKQGFERWQENLAFLHTLENDRKLTDAQVKLIEGFAKFWSESHYRVDTKENIRIHKSLF